MSSRSSRESSLSKIERKVLRNTFHAHRNHLKNKRVYRSADCSPASRPLCLTEPPLYLDFSSVRSAQPGLTEIDLSAISTASYAFCSLQDLITSARPGAVITLPPYLINLQSLTIQKPLTLKGAPGSVLVTSGICIDYVSKQNAADQGVSLCEFSLHFQKESTKALFTVKSPGALLQVRDCDVKNLSTGETTCFSLNEPHVTSNLLTQLKLLSCDLRDFGEIVKAGQDASVLVEKCHIQSCSKNAIHVTNPYHLIIRQCVIEQCAQSAVEITVLPARLPRQELARRKVRITNSDIRNSGCYGIHLWSDEFSQFPMEFALHKSKVTHSGREGLALRHVSLSQILIDSNDFTCNFGSGCWLQKTTDTTGVVQMAFNRSCDSFSGYGLYLYETSACLHNNEAARNKLGGVMVVGSSSHRKAEAPSTVRIERAVISQNGEYGLGVLDFFNGIVSLEHSKVTENQASGVQLVQSVETLATAHSARGRVSPEQPVSGKVHIRHCLIASNHGFGLTVENLECSVEKSDVRDNEQGVVQMKENGHLVWTDNQQEDPTGKKGACGSGHCSLF